MPVEVVHVIDDDVDVRQSLAFLLTAAGFAVRVHESAVAFLTVLTEVKEGCVLTDIRMPQMNGLELQRHLGEVSAGLPVIVMTGHGDVPLAVEAMKAGAVDFIEKPFGDEVILASIEGALKRKPRVTDPSLVERLDSLTPREREVLELLVVGHPNKVIAHRLDISPRTVEIHRAHVMEKMKARSLPELVRTAMQAGVAPQV